jgi:fructosamine-3-kinase
VAGEDVLRSALKQLAPRGKGVVQTRIGRAFAKVWADAPEDFFRAEAEGLGLLARHGVKVPEVLAVSPEAIVLEFVETSAPRRELAEEFGRALAGLHKARLPRFGAPWPGFIGPLAVGNGPADSWRDFYIGCKLGPLLEQAKKAGSDPQVVGAVEQALGSIPYLFPEDEPPSPVHGDLWAGNLLWTDSGVVLIDPSAHGGHRELDVSMLRLFGAPYLDAILGAYCEVHPLDPRYEERAAATELYYLLVHYILFGEAYRGSLLAACREVCAAAGASKA